MIKYILSFMLFLYSIAFCDFISDKSIGGIVDRSTLTTIVSSALDADSNGTYQGRQIVFVSANKNINFAARLILNFYADYDSLYFDPPLLVAPTVGDSFYIVPTFSFDMEDLGSIADTTKKTILSSPYTPIKTDDDGNVQTLADIILGARDGWYLRWYPTNTNPKDSCQMVNPSLGNDSIYAVVKLFKNNNVTHTQKFEKK